MNDLPISRPSLAYRAGIFDNGRLAQRIARTSEPMRKHILLTGAGFTHNWGGWLAKELEGDLLARLASRPKLRSLIQTSKNYEEALAMARSRQGTAASLNDNDLQALEGAIQESFWAMNTALGQRYSLFLGGKQTVLDFLAKFDAIFTLNQDLLLEFFYDPARPSSRWSGTWFPGIQPPILPGLGKREVVRLERRVGTIEPTDSNRQPIYKLHGSVEWLDGTDSLFVVGGGKEAYIRSKPLLVRYFEILREHLQTGEVRLMIIGYGFADEHVNGLIVDSAQSNPQLSLYFVNPNGRDAVLQGKDTSTVGYSPPDLASVPCIGESRRPLLTTFGGDQLEYEKVMRFFET